MKRELRPLAALILALALGGCASIIGRAQGGTLAVTSAGSEPARLSASLRTAVYAHDQGAGTSIFVSDLPMERLLAGDFEQGQVLHLELLWVPRSGTTPMDRTATNLSVRHVIFSGDQVGVYGGAGFALTAGRPGDRIFSLEVRDAPLRLEHRTSGFVDVLERAQLQGHLAARLDGAAVRRLRMALSQRVTDALGTTRLVSNDPLSRSGSG